VRIDVISVILSAFGFGGLVYGLTLSGESGPASASPFMLWGSLVVGVVGLAAFITRQLLLQRRDRALLDLRTFRYPIFTVSIALMSITTASMFGVIIVLPLYLQHVLHLDTLSTGLILLPGGLIMGLASPFVGRLYDRYDPRVLVVPGSILVSLVLWSLTMLTEHTPVGLVIAAHVVMSLGLSMMFTPLFTAGLGAVPPHLYSHGSAILGTIQQVGGAAGTALLIAVLTLQATGLAAGGAGVDAAQAGGIRAAFVAGAIISLFAVAGSFFLRKPADLPAEAPALAH